MTRDHPRIGSSLDAWLDEQGLRQEATASAIKAVIALQLSRSMKEQGITKTRMAERMGTSRAQLDRLLDPENVGVTLETLQRAAAVVGRDLRLELV